jgi:glyoxylase-like metal-dependent hydrolase (beta-lactamase superfamily II)
MTRRLALSLLLCVACAHPAANATAAAPAIYRGTRNFTNHYLVVGQRVVVVDSGRPGRAKWIDRELERVGRTPLDVTLVVLTHAHGDHAGSAKALQERLDVPVAVGVGDEPTLAQGHNPPLRPASRLGKALRPFIRKKFPPMLPDVVVRQPLDLRPYGVDGEIVPVGGHTPGSLAVVLRSGEVLSGDLVRGRLPARHRPVEHFFQDDVTAAHAAIAALLARGARFFHPGHGGPLSAADVKAWLAKP